MKKMCFMGLFALTLIASFAFKVEKKQFNVTCTAWSTLHPDQCESLLITDDGCDMGGLGSQCTTWIAEGTLQPAYSLQGNAFDCTYPLYHPF